MKSKSGWDGKLRLNQEEGEDKDTDNESNQASENESQQDGDENRATTMTATRGHAVITNPDAKTDPNYDDPNAPPVEVIEADEDLLADEESDVEDIDLVHSRIQSIPALHLERFRNLERICLRQNHITYISFPDDVAERLTELDLYDNSIAHIRGTDKMTNLVMLDL
ncbi:hypothetical protein KEM55_000040, partial [Ascosphaera atra]